MGEKRKQRSENVGKEYRRQILNVLFRQKLQDVKFIELVKKGFIREIENGQGESVHL